MAIAATTAVVAVAIPATAVGPQAQIFYGGCDLFVNPPAAHFTTSFLSPVDAFRNVHIRKLGTAGFGDLAPVPANVREWKDLVAPSTGTWEVTVRFGSETGRILDQKTQFVSCPGLP